MRYLSGLSHTSLSSLSKKLQLIKHKFLSKHRLQSLLLFTFIYEVKFLMFKAILTAFYSLHGSSSFFIERQQINCHQHLKLLATREQLHQSVLDSNNNFISKLDLPSSYCMRSANCQPVTPRVLRKHKKSTNFKMHHRKSLLPTKRLHFYTVFPSAGIEYGWKKILIQKKHLS